MNFKKFGLLFWFSVMMVIFGVAIITIGVILRAIYYSGEGIIETSFLSAPTILIIVGAFIIVIAFVGCCGSIAESFFGVLIFSVLLSIVFMLVVAGSIASYTYRNELETILKTSFNETINQYTTNKEVEKTWDIMQHDLECCGIEGPEDWRNIFHNDTLPASCCSEIPFDPDNNGYFCKRKDTYVAGCYPLLFETLRKSSLIIGSVVLGIAIIIGTVTCYSCLAAASLRKGYHSV